MLLFGVLPLQPHCYSLLTTIAPLWWSSDQGLIRIAENFRAEGAKNKLTPFFWPFLGHFWTQIYLFSPKSCFAQIKATA